MNEYGREEQKKLFAHYYQQLHINGKMFFAGHLLQRAFRLFPNNIALIYEQTTVTFKDLYYCAVAISKKLQEKGIQPRDRVCVLYENSIEFYKAYFGIWQTGAVVVPLNTYLHEKEFKHIINDAQPKAVLVSDSLKSKIAGILAEGSFFCIDEQDVRNLKAADAEVEAFDTVSLLPDEIAALLYTSGTTGVPKGVMLSSRNILTNIAQGLSVIRVTSADRVFGILPLFHSFAQFICVWGSFFLGSSTILVPKIDRRYIVENLRHEPTVIIGVPALYGLLCLMRAPLAHMRYLISGGDALPDKIRAGVELLYRRKICNGYGMTETSPLIAACFDDELIETSTVGYPVINLECSIRDEQENEVVRGHTGILWVKGDNVMLGYYNDQPSTDKMLKNGWLNTGDCAFFDTKGRLVISGRQKDIIKNKGFMIYPQEIENIILLHQHVMQVGVVGKIDESVGEVPVAFVVLRQAVPDIEKELKNICTQHLANYKIPRQFIILDKMPLTALGKIDKKFLKKEYFKV